LKASTLAGHVIKVSRLGLNLQSKVSTVYQTGSYAKNFNINLGINHFLKNFKHPMPKKWAWIGNAQYS